MSLLPVADALALMRAAASRIKDRETVPLAETAGRVLAADLFAARDQPPFPASAMDGYAVRAADLPGRLKVIGESAAGRRCAGPIAPGECCRIFTGAVVPDGADAILIQEDADRDGEFVVAQNGIETGRYIRPAGLDYRRGDTLLAARSRLGASAIALHASAGGADAEVIRRPRVAIIMSGDELALPGEDLSPDGIYASNGLGVAAIVTAAGGEAVDCGIVRDDRDAIRQLLEGLEAIDIVVTLGGASVGDHDLIGPALEEHGVEMAFLKLAMRPGKPVMFGKRGSRLFLGLPGNPVSSLVGAHVLLVPLIESLLGLETGDKRQTARLAVDLPENGDREHYMRARFTPAGVEPFENQDSSLLRVLATADVLIVREAGESALEAGESVQILHI